MKNRLHNKFFTLLLLLVFFDTQAQATIQSGMIVIVNGTSSAGKTTALCALQAMHTDLQIASIDTYTRAHPQGSWETKCSKFYKEVREKAIAGQTVVVDTVLYHKNYARYNALLQNINTTDHQRTQPIKLIKILIYCPLDAIIDHVQKRNKSSNSLDHRTIHKAFIVFLSLYKLQKSPNNIIIDTIDSATTLAALQNALTARYIASHPSIRKQTKINRKIINRFKLNRSTKSHLTAQHAWDLIINSAIHSPEAIAQYIADFVTLCKS